ncbi:14531_t:CDS:2 [Gigaspora rosea]|nr:14531_t:CDS:2 [Gigaspora rosea]
MLKNTSVTSVDLFFSDEISHEFKYREIDGYGDLHCDNILTPVDHKDDDVVGVIPFLAPEILTSLAC